MTCKHCGETTNLNRILCDDCSKKALQVLPADPKERIPIYRILIEEASNPVSRMAAEQLLEMDMDTLNDRMVDPNDRMFNERDS